MKTEGEEQTHGRAEKRSRMTYTASDAFFEALGMAGVENCFVNMGSDHPSFLEAMARGIASQNKRTADPHAVKFPKMITCPNEMVAMSMADGYARFTGKPQCVLVHVDVGTQGLGAAVHNASCGRAPVLVFAGLSPYTHDGELPGSRTEFIHWIQDVPDQKRIVDRYCRYSGEVKRGVNVRQMVWRALSFATSYPQGPVYLTAAREPMEEEIQKLTDDEHERVSKVKPWKASKLGEISRDDAAEIVGVLAAATLPLVITGYSGRNQEAPQELQRLSELVPRLRVLDTAGSDMCYPAGPGWLGLRFGEHELIPKADAILVIDCDVPWIPARCRPSSNCRVFHIDSDPLKVNMNVVSYDAEVRLQVDSFLSLRVINQYLTDFRAEITPHADPTRSTEFEERIAEISAAATVPQGAPVLTSSYLGQELQKHCPQETAWVIEAVTQTVAIADQLQVTKPGHWLNCGGGGLGWSGGAALGVKLALIDNIPKRSSSPDVGFVCQVVGDGTFLFTVPSSVAWISARYKLPVLTIVLVNGGWHAPRRSLYLVHPDGDAAAMIREDNYKAVNGSQQQSTTPMTPAAQLQAHTHSLRLPLSITDPQPIYGEIARAASGNTIWCLPPNVEVRDPVSLDKYLKEAISVVKTGRSAVLDVYVG